MYLEMSSCHSVLEQFHCSIIRLNYIYSWFLGDLPLQSKLPPNPDESSHKKGLDPVLYCTEWYMSIFSR